MLCPAVEGPLRPIIMYRVKRHRLNIDRRPARVNPPASTRNLFYGLRDTVIWEEIAETGVKTSTPLALFGWGSQTDK